MLITLGVLFAAKDHKHAIAGELNDVTVIWKKRLKFESLDKLTLSDFDSEIAASAKEYLEKVKKQNIKLWNEKKLFLNVSNLSKKMDKKEFSF